MTKRKQTALALAEAMGIELPHDGEGMSAAEIMAHCIDAQAEARGKAKTPREEEIDEESEDDDDDDDAEIEAAKKAAGRSPRRRGKARSAQGQASLALVAER